MANPSPEVRQQFLLEFTRTIIETLASQQKSEISIPAEEIIPSMNIVPDKTFLPPQLARQTISFDIPSQKLLTQNQEKISPAITIETSPLKTILEDDNINAIECQGPDKQIVLRKQGATSLSQIKLSEEEIQKQIKQWSENTNTPISNGILRANNENLTITAVISDLIGSRFILIRKPSSAHVR